MKPTRLTGMGEPSSGAQAGGSPDVVHLRDDDAFLTVLGEAIATLETHGIPYILIGGVASAAMGRPRWTKDADIFVPPDEALRTLEALTAAGFRTEETDPVWLYKAFKHDVMIDVIFRSKGDLYLDDDMLEHSQVREFRGVRMRTAAAEDIIVQKAITHEEHMPHHWHDALGLIASGEIDWDYLVTRAMRQGTRRVLSLLLYAQSNDLPVPARAVRQLYEAVFTS